MLLMIILLFKKIMAFIDGIIYGLVDVIYELLLNITKVNIASETTIKAFSQRIGVVLGLFMMFSLSIKILNYIISPEKVDDKANGTKKIITNIIISFAILALYNTIFSTAYKVQNKILEKNVIPQLIFGAYQSEEDSEKFGKQLGFDVFTSFMSINTNLTPNCTRVYLSNEGMELCEQTLNDIGISTQVIQQFIDSVESRNIKGLLEDYDLPMATHNGISLFNYSFIISTATGVILILILISFCFDIALRLVKLYFFQLIAPIPIISNVIPGKGEEVFKKWYKNCITTYLDLFIRLFAVFFAIYLITITNQNLQEVYEGHPFIKLFVILGILMFAKQLPQLISDITGLKMDGKFTINPLKKMNDIPLVGKALGAAGGAIAGGRAGGRVGNTLGGALTGAFMGASSVPLMGHKDGKFALTSATNDVYKKMTGNDFVNFSLWKAPLMMGAEGKIKEIKDARNVAQEHLNELNTQLNISENRTASLGNSLSAKGVDLANIGAYTTTLDEEIIAKNEDIRKTEQEVQNKLNEYRALEAGATAAATEIANLNGLKSQVKNQIAEKLKKIEEYKNHEMLKYQPDFYDTEIRQLEQEISSLNKDVSNYDEKISDEQIKIKDHQNAEKTYNDLNNRLTELKTELSTLESNRQNVIDEISEYNKNVENENKLRKEIALVNKDIDDLTKEKTQRERFYEYDPSPNEDINKVLKETETDDAYRKRIQNRASK